MFDGSLGDFKTSPVHLELKEGAKPYHGKAFPVPHIHKKTLKKEIERLVALGVLRKCSDSEWGCPTFIIPKKNGTVRFISDFRKLNEQLKRKPYPIPKIAEMLQELESFTFATSLDLNMGYYTIRLDADTQKLCTIVTPFGKFQYLRLPMGVSCSPDIFQDKMSDLMQSLDFVKTYLDDLLIISTSTFEDHLQKLESVLEILDEHGLRCNAEKSTFCTDSIEYLGYWITREGIQPMPNKVTAIHEMQPPTTRKQLRRFIGLVNYYRDMWPKRSELLAPLTDLTSKNKPFKWKEHHQKAFEAVKQAIVKDVMLSYPNFSKPFHINLLSLEARLCRWEKRVDAIFIHFNLFKKLPCLLKTFINPKTRMEKNYKFINTIFLGC